MQRLTNALLNVQRNGPQWTCRVSGELEQEDVTALEADLLEGMSADGADWLLDLREVSYFDSSLLHMLYRLHFFTLKESRRLTARVDRFQKNIFHLVGLDDLIWTEAGQESQNRIEEASETPFSTSAPQREMAVF
jgi:anti-anti-sigma regulatory factor